MRDLIERGFILFHRMVRFWDQAAPPSMTTAQEDGWQTFRNILIGKTREAGLNSHLPKGLKVEWPGKARTVRSRHGCEKLLGSGLTSPDD